MTDMRELIGKAVINKRLTKTQGASLLRHRRHHTEGHMLLMMRLMIEKNHTFADAHKAARGRGSADLRGLLQVQECPAPAAEAESLDNLTSKLIYLNEAWIVGTPATARHRFRPPMPPLCGAFSGIRHTQFRSRTRLMYNEDEFRVT